MTVEQFFELPDPIGNFTYELHFGELVKVGRANIGHYDLQELIRDILIRNLDQVLWKVGIEMPYGLTPGYDARAADVGVALRKNWDAVPKQNFLIGSPELVVHVKSRSNRDRKMEADAVTHITHGAAAVLLVKEERREIVMVTAASRTVYSPGDSIELPAPLSISLSVDEIFAASNDRSI